MKYRNDSVLGKLKPYMYRGKFCNWEGEVTVKSFSEAVTFWVPASDMTSEIADSNRLTFQEFVSNHAHYKRETLKAVHKMIIKHPKDYGVYEYKELQKVFGRLANSASQEKLLARPHLYLLKPKKNKLRLGLGFWKWFFDDEHGVGVIFENGKAVSVGAMWVAQDAGPGFKVNRL